jgi:hypothetical protein
MQRRARKCRGERCRDEHRRAKEEAEREMTQHTGFWRCDWKAMKSCFFYFLKHRERRFASTALPLPILLSFSSSSAVIDVRSGVK